MTTSAEITQRTDQTIPSKETQKNVREGNITSIIYNNFRTSATITVSFKSGEIKDFVMGVFEMKFFGTNAIGDPVIEKNGKIRLNPSKE